MNKWKQFQALPLSDRICISLCFIPDNSGQRKGSEDNGLNCNRTDKKNQLQLALRIDSSLGA